MGVIGFNNGCKVSTMWVNASSIVRVVQESRMMRTTCTDVYVVSDLHNGLSDNDLLTYCTTNNICKIK